MGQNAFLKEKSNNKNSNEILKKTSFKTKRDWILPVAFSLPKTTKPYPRKSCSSSLFQYKRKVITRRLPRRPSKLILFDYNSWNQKKIHWPLLLRARSFRDLDLVRDGNFEEVVNIQRGQTQGTNLWFYLALKDDECGTNRFLTSDIISIIASHSSQFYFSIKIRQ